MRNKITIAIVLCLSAALTAGAQSKSFTLSKWAEIQFSLLKELNRSYVDSLPVDRIEKAGIDAMLQALDPYTVFIPEEEKEDIDMIVSGAYGGIGAVIYKPYTDSLLVINEPYEGSPAAQAGLQCGDRILSINGVSTIGLTSKQCSDRMKGEPGTELKLSVAKVRDGGTAELTIKRRRIHLPSLEYSGFIGDGTVGYVFLSGFTEGVGQQFRDELASLCSEKPMSRFVLDLRGNGGGLLSEAITIVSSFVPKGSVVVSSKSRTDSTVYRTKLEPVLKDTPVIVLIDGGSASASEIVSGALQDLGRATIMGTRSFGKGLVQSIVGLPYGAKLKVTTSKYYTPSGRCVQEIDYSNGRNRIDGAGIKPDVVIERAPYSRLAYSMVYNAIIEGFVLEYVERHADVPSEDEFSLPDEEFEAFVKYACGREFDYRSAAKTYFDMMVEELRVDGLEEEFAAQTQAMKEALDISKEQYIRLRKDELLPLIEEEIIVRYRYQKEGIRLRLRYDAQLAKALESPLK